MDLEGRSAIVTGGSGGLGAATVRHLVGIGVPTTILDLQTDGADALRDELGDLVSVVGGSVLDGEPVEAAIATAGANGRLSIVVNIAGGGVATRTLARSHARTRRHAARPRVVRTGRLAQPRGLVQRLTSRRGCDGDERARLVETILRNPYLNGTTIRLDGGTRFPPR